MPKGVPTPKAPPTMTVEIVLRRENYDALQKLAEDQYRTPQLQAGFMIRNVLAATKSDHVAALLEHARTKNGSGEQA